MAFLKKYPILVATLAVLIAVFAAQAVLAFLELGDLDRAKRDYEQAQRQLKSLLTPGGEEALALTQVNVEKIQSAVKNEQGVFKDVISGLGGAGKTVSAAGMPANGRDMLFNLQGFVDELRREAQKEADIVNPQTGLTETKPQIELPPNLYFGFGYYMGENVPPPADASVPALFQQREVLDYLVRALYASRPKNQPLTLVSIEREVVTGEKIEVKDDDSSSSRRSRRSDKGASAEVFEINPLVSARVEGAITAVAFRLKFIGYTDALRNFLNTLGKFELPLVVRSVEVQPANKSTANQRKPQAKPVGFEALFGSSTPAAGAAAGAKPFVPKAPVISENLSEFTVVVEYVSITDPAQKKPAPAPAAQQ